MPPDPQSLPPERRAFIEQGIEKVRSYEACDPLGEVALASLNAWADIAEELLVEIDRLTALVAGRGGCQPGGGKPFVPIQVKGKPLSEEIIEDRR